MRDVDAGFQALLAIIFTVASARLFYTAIVQESGRRSFRAVGGTLSGLWALFYYHAAFGDAPLENLADLARILQFWNVTMFILWGWLVRDQDCDDVAVRQLIKILGERDYEDE